MHTSGDATGVDVLLERLRHGEAEVAPWLVSILIPSITHCAVDSASHLSQADLEEAAEAAIARAIEKLPLFDSSRASFPTWVCGFFRNEIRRRLPAPLSLSQLIEVPSSSFGDSEFEDWEFEAEPSGRSFATPRLKEIVGALGEADQQILRLRHQSLSYEKISARLGVSEDAARQRHSRALKRAGKLVATGIPLTDPLRESWL